MLITYLQFVFIMICILCLIIFVGIIFTKVELNKNHKHKILTGMEVTHGMTFKKGKRGVNRTQQPSHEYYRRLFK